MALTARHRYPKESFGTANWTLIGPRFFIYIRRFICKTLAKSVIASVDAPAS